jgi:Spy/CpxP family protein refolding chaperone
MKKRTLIVLAAVVLLAATAFAGQRVWAQVNEAQTALQMERALLPGLFERRFGPGQRDNDQPFLRRFLARIGSYLDLTEAQRAQLKVILETERPKLQPLVIQAVITHKAIVEATKTGEFNEAQIRVLATQQGQTVANLIVEKERVKTQIYQVLTPEQRTKLEQLRQRFETRVREHFLPQ